MNIKRIELEKFMRWEGIYGMIIVFTLIAMTEWLMINIVVKIIYELDQFPLQYTEQIIFTGILICLFAEYKSHKYYTLTRDS